LGLHSGEGCVPQGEKLIFEAVEIGCRLAAHRHRLDLFKKCHLALVTKSTISLFIRPCGPEG
jgi:hypothetical protein